MSPRALFLGLALLAGGRAAGLAQAAAAAVAPSAHAIAEVRALIEAEMARTLAPGVSIAVSRGGRLVWSETIGCADLELDAAVTKTTRMRIGSVSKPLTAAALGRLVEQGRLDLDAPVQTYVPDFPRKAWPITTRQLAGHVAGVRHYEQGEFESRTPYATVRESLGVFEKDALLFEPGTRFSYSSYGWNLISAVLEGASGEKFLDLMQETVFGPAGMTHTGPDDAARIVPGRAHFYTRDPESGVVVNAGFVDNSVKWAGGGFVSTAEDLVAFGNAMLEDRLMKPETRRLLWTSQKTADGKADPLRHGLERGHGFARPVSRPPLGRSAGRHGEPRDLSGRRPGRGDDRQQRRVFHRKDAARRGGVSR